VSVPLTHLLDTGWIVRHLRGSASHTETVRRIGPPSLAVSIVTLAELAEGVCRASDPAAARRAVDTFLSDKVVLPLTTEICDRFGRERAALRGQNLLIGDMDLFIAATCLEHGLTLLSPNRKHFERMPGLSLVSEPLP
jgi:predicted nucleic acid-binding protein